MPPAACVKQLVLLLTFCNVQISAANSSGLRSTDDVPRVYWQSSFETGDLSEWDPRSGKTAFHNRGIHEVTPSAARSGQFGIKLTVNGARSKKTAARIFLRHIDSHPLPDGYYGTWLFVPHNYTPASWWNVFQFKSRFRDQSKPAFSVNIGRDAMGMYLYVWDKANGGRLRRPKPRLPLRARVWTHISAYIEQSNSFNGQFVLFQDGREIVRLDDVRTMLDKDARLHWAVNNYTDDISSDMLPPGRAVLYFDDCTVTEFWPKDAPSRK